MRASVKPDKRKITLVLACNILVKAHKINFNLVEMLPSCPF